ncbi:MAG: cobalamin B12-binding domain-containing protein [Verrucomicrobia bacterium]|nr:cobalamin B12-binding domain-containing protein [Verrucomicrobiota bacterium]
MNHQINQLQMNAGSIPGRAVALRVLLVYSNRTRILEPTPPIGLSYVATATRAAGHAVRFVDLMVSRNPEADLRRALREFKPDVVGISVRNIDNVVAQRVAWHLDELDAILATVRANSPARIVLGGPAISILGPVALERLDADFAIVGEGEEAFPELLSALAGQREFEGISGLCYRDGARIKSIPPVHQETFGSSGMGDWVKWRAYERGGGTWAIHTKRGCPLQCLYCNYPVMEGHRLRQRAAADVVDEIEHVLATIGPRTFEFTDSTFNVPESHARGICEEVLRRKLRVNLSAVGINPLTLSEELFTLMKRAGFISLVITPDSASAAMLGNLRKGFTVEQVRNTARWARESGIRCTWFFLFGGPGETNATAEETVSFVEEHLNWKRFLTVMMTGVRILPGTDLARHAVATGYIAADRDLCEPMFYFSPALDEAWLLGRINRASGRCPTIVHGAEENGSTAERWFNQALYWLGAAPPYYRFLPMFLRLPPLPTLRARNTDVGLTASEHRR